MTAAQLIAQEQAKCEAATPGPWEHNDRTAVVYVPGVSGSIAVVHGGVEDAAFIASARTGYLAALKALDEIERLIHRNYPHEWETFKDCPCAICRLVAPHLAAFLAAFKPETQGDGKN